MGYPLQYSWASLGAQMVKNPSAMLEIWDLSLSWEDPLEEGMTTHSSILAWRIPWTEEPGGLQSTGSQTATHNGQTKHAQIKYKRGFIFTYITIFSCTILVKTFRSEVNTILSSITLH